MAGRGRDPIRAAFEALPRERFLSPSQRRQAGYDGPLDIGFGQTCSQPRTVEAMLRLLDVHRGDRVLEVGSGSGWATALLGHLTGQRGSVLGLEIVAELAASGADHLRSNRIEHARIEQATPGVLGRPDGAPYDRILVSAGARRLPEPLVEQLGDGARLVVPVAGTMLLVVRHGPEVEVTEHGAYRFVPLIT